MKAERIRTAGDDRLLCTEEDHITRADAVKEIVWAEKAKQLAASFHVSLGHVGADNLFKHVNISVYQYICMKLKSHVIRQCVDKISKIHSTLYIENLYSIFENYLK